MNYSAVRAKQLARSLLVLNQDFGMSWREIAIYVYNEKVNFATLNRIAKSKGKWVPKDPAIQTALGLLKPRSPFAVLPKWFERTPEALAWFKGKKQIVKDMSQESRASLKKAKGYR